MWGWVHLLTKSTLSEWSALRCTRITCKLGHTVWYSRHISFFLSVYCSVRWVLPIKHNPTVHLYVPKYSHKLVAVRSSCIKFINEKSPYGLFWNIDFTEILCYLHAIHAFKVCVNLLGSTWHDLELTRHQRVPFFESLCQNKENLEFLPNTTLLKRLIANLVLSPHQSKKWHRGATSGQHVTSSARRVLGPPRPRARGTTQPSRCAPGPDSPRPCTKGMNTPGTLRVHHFMWNLLFWIKFCHFMWKLWIISSDNRVHHFMRQYIFRRGGNTWKVKQPRKARDFIHPIWNASLAA